MKAPLIIGDSIEKGFTPAPDFPPLGFSEVERRYNDINKYLFIGMDFGSQSDYTAICKMERQPDGTFVVKHLKLKNVYRGVKRSRVSKRQLKIKYARAALKYSGQSISKVWIDEAQHIPEGWKP